MDATELCFTPATALAAAIRARTLSPVEIPFTFPFNLTGHPAASVPCGFTSDGLPAALQIVGRWHADTLVLQAAAAFEQAAPWAERRPSL